MSKTAPVTPDAPTTEAAPPAEVQEPRVNPAALLVEQLQQERQKAEEQIANWTRIRDLKTQQIALFIQQIPQTPPQENRAARRRAGS